MAVSKSKKAVPSALVVTDLELFEVTTARLRLQEAKKLAKSAEAATEAAEERVMAKLRAGAVVESKNYRAVIEKVLGACRPKWQELWFNHMAAEHGIAEKQANEEARAKYPAKEHDELVIGAVAS